MMEEGNFNFLFFDKRQKILEKLLIITVKINF